MTRKLYLDDIRNPPDETWEVVRTADACIRVLDAGTVTHLSLDHDLAFEHYAAVSDANEITSPEDRPREKTGYDVCLWLRQKVETDPTYRMPRVVLHTANPVGRANMAAVLMEIADILTARMLEDG